MDKNRPQGRQRNVTGQGKGVHLGQKTGSGPVGSGTGPRPGSSTGSSGGGRAPQGRGSGTRPSGTGGNGLGGGRSSGGGRSPLGLIIILAILILGGGGGLGNLFGLFGGSGDAGTSGTGQSGSGYTSSGQSGSGTQEATGSSTAGTSVSGNGGSSATGTSSAAGTSSGSGNTSGSAASSGNNSAASSGNNSTASYGNNSAAASGSTAGTASSADSVSGLQNYLNLLLGGAGSYDSSDTYENYSAGSYPGTSAGSSGSSSASSAPASSSAAVTWASQYGSSQAVNRKVSEKARAKFTTLRGDGKDIVTILVYMCGTDLESKSGMATKDLQEMVNASVGSQVNLLVYTGGCTRWQNNAVSSNSNQIWQVKNGGLTCLVKNAGSSSMTAASTLTDFITYGAQNYPADRYELIFWDHGGGSLSGYGYDQKYPRTGSMSLAQIGKALSDGGIRFDFIGFDACLMATVENAKMLADYADYMIASEETEPGIGWYYTNWLNDLSRNTSLSTLDIGQRITDDFVSTCARQCYGQAATLSVVDLAELSQTLPQEMADFSKDLLNKIKGGEYKTVSAARNSTREFASSTRIDQIDFVDFANRLGTEEGAALARVLTEAVKYNRTSSGMTNAYGLSVYFPYRKMSSVSTALETYDELNMDSALADCFREFASLETGGQAASSGSGSPLDILLGGLFSGSGSYASGSGSSSYGTAENGSSASGSGSYGSGSYGTGSFGTGSGSYGSGSSGADLFDALFGGLSFDTGSGSYGSSPYGSGSYGGSAYGSGSYGGYGSSSSAWGTGGYGSGSYGNGGYYNSNSFGGSGSYGSGNYGATGTADIADLLTTLLGGGRALSADERGIETGFLESSTMDADSMAEYLAANQFDPSALTWQENEDGQPVMALDEEQWDLVQQLDLNLFYDTGDGYVDMGLDNVYSFDDDGNMQPDTSGAWISINDQPVAYYHLDTVTDGEEYAIYGKVPAWLNGERVNLILVFNQDYPKGFVAGAQPAYSPQETQTVARGLLELTEGDEITFLCDFYSYDGTFQDSHVLGEPLTVTGDLAISDTYLGEGSTRILYRFTDIYQQHYWSEALEVSAS